MNAQLTTVPQSQLTLQPAWNAEEIEIIKKSVAADATEPELKFFLYVASQRRLNPLLKQIYFMKDKSNKVSHITSIEGLRLIANRTGKLKGIERGIEIRDNQIYAWAKVYRADWTTPAYEEVAMSEYKKNFGVWQSMPRQMLKKCAEACALRMAFPEEMGGLYTSDEMPEFEKQTTHEEEREIYLQEKETVRTVMAEINDMIGAFSLEKEEVQSATGVKTFAGLSLAEMQEAKANLEKYIEVKTELSLEELITEQEAEASEHNT
jgi:phage recombination protein Bet